MPIYEYQCTQCGKIEEALQKFTDQPLSACRHCAGKLTKLISHSSFHLKGNGWYVTDYKNRSKSAASSEETKPDKTSGKDTKSAAASASPDKSASSKKAD